MLIWNNTMKWWIDGMVTRTSILGFDRIIVMLTNVHWSQIYKVNFIVTCSVRLRHNMRNSCMGYRSKAKCSEFEYVDVSKVILLYVEQYYNNIPDVRVLDQEKLRIISWHFNKCPSSGRDVKRRSHVKKCKAFRAV